MTSVAISANGRWLVAGAIDATVRVWDLDLDATMQQSREVVGRELTHEERKQYLLDK